MGQTHFCLFSFFSHDKYSKNLTDYKDKSVDGVIGTRTRGSKMVGADKSTVSYGGTPHLPDHLITLLYSTNLVSQKYVTFIHYC